MTGTSGHVCICKAEADVAVAVRGGPIQVEVERPAIRAVVPVTACINLCPW